MPTHGVTTGIHNVNSQFMSMPSINSQNVIKLPQLIVIEQPKQRIRFRYKSDPGCHGVLNGRTNKSYPAVKLENCPSNKDIIVRATLYTTEKQRCLHVHNFRNSTCEKGITECLDQNMTATFKALVVEHCGVRCAENVIFERLKGRNALGGVNNDALYKKQAKEEAKKIDLTKVCICFEAFDGNYEEPIAKTFSEVVYHENELKIARLSKYSSSVSGDEEVFLLCSKVNKDDIEVKFSQVNEQGEEMWSAKGEFGPADVHCQVAIVFKTPAYENVTDVQGDIDVRVQLYKPSSDYGSDPIKFLYHPVDKDQQEVNRKKRKMNHFGSLNECGETSSTLNPTSSECSPSNVHFASQSNDLKSHQVTNNCSTQTANVLYNAENVDEESLLDGFPDFDLTEEERTLFNRISDEILSFDSMEGYTGAVAQGGSIYEAENISVPYKTDSVAEKGVILVERNVGELNERFADLTVSSTQELDANEKGLLLPEKFAVLSKFVTSGKMSALIKGVRQCASAVNRDGDNLLHLAILHETRNTFLLYILLHILKGLHCNAVNQQNKLKQTPLHLAVLTDNASAVKLLLDYGAKPNIVEKHGNTAVHLAANLQMPKSLIQILRSTCGFQSLNAVNYNGITALHLAIISKCESCAKLLVEAGANINSKDEKSGRTALHLAVQHIPSIVRFFFSKSDVEVDAQDYTGNTALHIACANQLPEIALALMENNANPLIKNFDEEGGKTPYDFARGNQLLLKILAGEAHERPTETSNCDIMPEKFSPIALNAQASSLPPDSYCISNSGIQPLISEATLSTLEKMFNPPKTGWKDLALYLGMDEDLLSSISKLERSPTKAVLNRFKKDGGTLENLLHRLELAELKTAYNVVKQDTQNL